MGQKFTYQCIKIKWSIIKKFKWNLLPKQMLFDCSTELSIYYGSNEKDLDGKRESFIINKNFFIMLLLRELLNKFLARHISAIASWNLIFPLASLTFLDIMVRNWNNWPSQECGGELALLIPYVPVGIKETMKKKKIRR